MVRWSPGGNDKLPRLWSPLDDLPPEGSRDRRLSWSPPPVAVTSGGSGNGERTRRKALPSMEAREEESVYVDRAYPPGVRRLRTTSTQTSFGRRPMTTRGERYRQRTSPRSPRREGFLPAGASSSSRRRHKHPLPSPPRRSPKAGTRPRASPPCRVRVSPRARTSPLGSSPPIRPQGNVMTSLSQRSEHVGYEEGLSSAPTRDSVGTKNSLRRSTSLVAPGDTAEIASLCYALLQAGRGHLAAHEDERAAELFEESLRAADALSDRGLQRTACTHLAHVLGNIGQHEKAIQYHKLGLELARAAGDRSGERSALLALGNSYVLLPAYDEAIAILKDLVGLARTCGDPSTECAAWRLLGVAYSSRGEWIQARTCHERALTMAESMGDRAGVGVACGNLGNVNAAQGNLVEAIALYKRDLAICVDMQDTAGESSALCNLGVAHASMGDLDEAEEYHRRDLALATRLGDSGAYTTASRNLAEVVRMKKEKTERGSTVALLSPRGREALRKSLTLEGSTDEDG